MTPHQTWFDASPDAMIVVNDSGRIVYANQRCDELLGYPPAELEGQSIERLVPSRHARHAQVRAGYLKAPTVRPMGIGRELVALHKQGHEVPVEIALSPIVVDGVQHVVAAVRDARPQRALLEKLQLQSIALDAAATGVLITDRQGVIEWVNPAVCQMSGYRFDELKGQLPRIFKSGQHDDALFQELWATVTSGRTWRGSIINRRKDGALYHEEQTVSPVRAPDGEITHFIAVKQDITEQVAAQRALAAARDELARRVAEVEALHARLQEQAIRDPLTGLFNRRYLDETLPRELAHALRNRSSVTIAVIDADHFKTINDTHGHATGDKLLIALGQILQRRSRGGDVACRYGGEEFVVVLVDAGLGDGLACAEAWRSAFARVVVEGPEGPVNATCSIGVATWDARESAQRLFERADAAMYEAKRSGRDRVSAAS